MNKTTISATASSSIISVATSQLKNYIKAEQAFIDHYKEKITQLEQACHLVPASLCSSLFCELLENSDNDGHDIAHFIAIRYAPRSQSLAEIISAVSEVFRSWEKEELPMTACESAPSKPSETSPLRNFIKAGNELLHHYKEKITQLEQACDLAQDSLDIPLFCELIEDRSNDGLEIAQAILREYPLRSQSAAEIISAVADVVRTWEKEELSMPHIESAPSKPEQEDLLLDLMIPRDTMAKLTRQAQANNITPTEQAIRILTSHEIARGLVTS